MVGEFIRRHNTDFAVLQEVTIVHSITMKGYQVSDNVGTLGRARQYSIRKTYRCTRYGDQKDENGKPGCQQVQII